MKICHVIFSLKIGGTESMLVDIINHQIKENKLTIIIINNLYDNLLLEKISPNVKIIKLNRVPNSFDLLAVIKLNWYINYIIPDIIHCHNYNIIRYLFSITNAKIVLTAHCLNIPINNLDRYDRIFTVSEAVRCDINIRGKLDAIVVYNGIKFDLLSKSKQTKDKFSILQIGRLDYKIKGQDILIKAIAYLKESSIDVRVDFVGEGDRKEYLIKLIEKFQLTDRVKFLGNIERENLYKLIGEYSLLVHPAREEGFGLVIIEAMAAKIPVLVSDIAGPMEIIRNGKYGYYFKNESFEECASQIKNILEAVENKQICEKIEAAYEYAKRYYSIEITSEKYLSYYKALIAPKYFP